MQPRFLLLALPLLVAAAPADRIAGRYRLTGEHDAASELILFPDGRFDYGLAYGALDEAADGRWTRDGDHLHLVTLPKPVPATFSTAASGESKEAPLLIKVSNPEGRGLALIDFVIGFADGSTADGYTQEDGWSLDPGDRRVPAWVQLALPMYGLTSPRFAVDPSKGNVLNFVLTPNDLGRLDFEAIPVESQPGKLIVHRGQASLTYVREGNAPTPPPP